MPENKAHLLPEFASLDAMVEFFDTNDLGDYLDQLPDAEFEVNLKKNTRLIPVDAEVARKLSVIAQQQHLPPEALVNQWLSEKLADYSA